MSLGVTATGKSLRVIHATYQLLTGEVRVRVFLPQLLTQPLHSPKPIYLKDTPSPQREQSTVLKPTFTITPLHSPFVSLRQ